MVEFEQAQKNFHEAATMPVGSAFYLPASGVSSRTIRQAEQLCNKLRQAAGNPGRVQIARRGSVAEVKVMQ